MINELCKKAHEYAVKNGFYENGHRSFCELIALIHCELSEAIEAERNGESVEPERQERAHEFTFSSWTEWDIEVFNSIMRGTIEEEIADACIRIFDLCGYYGIDLESWIKAKMAYNATRSHKHGKAY